MRLVTSLLTAVVVVQFMACAGDDPVIRSSPAEAGAGGGDAGDAGDDATAPVDGAAADGGADGALGDAGPIPVTAGDVVVLSGETLIADGVDKITEWRNAIAPLGVIAKPVTNTGPKKIVVTLASGAMAACAAWAEGDSPLAAQADAAFALGSADYSVTAVVMQGPKITDLRDNGRVVASIVDLNASTGWYSGFALMTEYQDPQRTSATKAVKFATRISYNNGSAVEVVEPTLSSPTRQVVVAYRRGDELFMRVGTATHGPVAGAALVPVPASRALILGSTRTDGDPDTRFAGQLCALVIHKGSESDAAITARADALTARFVNP